MKTRYKNNTLKQVRKSRWKFDEYCRRGVELITECPCCGKRYRQHTICNREDCPVCGKEYSYAHYRRYVRGLPHIFEMFKEGYVGYMVITSVNYQKERKYFQDVRRYTIRLLKRELKGIKGVARWHWAGDIGKRFYPHLNILFTYGYIDEDKLKRIKQLIEERLQVKVVFYRYTKNFDKVFHWWCYVSRPTFLLQNEVDYSVVKGMQNVVWFGKFEKGDEKMLDREGWIVKIKKLFEVGYLDLNKEWEFYSVYSMLRNRCPYCGEKLKWTRLRIDSDDYYWENYDKVRHLGAGFYEYL
jgi:hypothetical protein